MRDYDVYVYATADPRTGVAPAHPDTDSLIAFVRR
jgi:hypothetical protein